MRKRGLTLIELLVVAAIIAVLIAILLPALGKAREVAKRSACLANMHGITNGLTVYASEYGAYPFASVTGLSTTPKDPSALLPSGWPTINKQLSMGCFLRACGATITTMA